METSYIYMACMIASAIFASIFLFLLVWNIVNKFRWRKIPQCFFLTLLILISLLWFVDYALSFSTDLAELVKAEGMPTTVSWPGLYICQYSVSRVAEFLLIIAMYYILHNRLRAVAVPEKIVSIIAVIHWPLYAIVFLHVILLLASAWFFSTYYLHGFQTRLSADHVPSNPRFYRGISVSYDVLRLLIQLEMLAFGGVVLMKSKKNPGGRMVGESPAAGTPHTLNNFEMALQTILLFFIGSLATYTIVPVTGVVITFKYWNAETTPPRLFLFYWVIIGCARSVCVLFICLTTTMMDRQQWELGTTTGNSEMWVRLNMQLHLG